MQSSGILGRSSARLAGGALVLLGVILAAVGLATNARQRPLVARLPLSTATPAHDETRFRIDRAAPYEVEIELDWDALDDATLEELRAHEDTPQLALTWSVSTDSGRSGDAGAGGRSGDAGAGEVVARGDGREYDYISPWKGKRERMMDRLLLRAGHRAVDVATTARGLGGFDARAGQDYTLRVLTESLPEAVWAGAPQFCVRLHRGVAKRQRARADALLGGGGAALVSGLALLLFTSLSARTRRGRGITTS